MGLQPGYQGRVLPSTLTHQRAEPGPEPVISLNSLSGAMGFGGERCCVNVRHHLLVHYIQAEKHSVPETLQHGVRRDLGEHIAQDIWMLVERSHVISVTLNHPMHFPLSPYFI